MMRSDPASCVVVVSTEEYLNTSSEVFNMNLAAACPATEHVPWCAMGGEGWPLKPLCVCGVRKKSSDFRSGS